MLQLQLLSLATAEAARMLKKKDGLEEFCKLECRDETACC
jgi:hypothetical protein